MLRARFGWEVMGALGIALMGTGLPCLGAAADTPALNLCLSAPDGAQLLRIASPPNAGLRDLIQDRITVRATVAGALVASGRGNGTIAAPAAVPPSRQSGCATLGNVVGLRDVSTIPGSVVAAYGAVVAFRRHFTWPRGAADLDDPATAVRLTVVDPSAPYVGVAIITTPKAPSLGCFDETYRVDIPSLIVRPYEGCVEGHPASGLPHWRDLPPPNAPEERPPHP